MILLLACVTPDAGDSSDKDTGATQDTDTSEGTSVTSATAPAWVEALETIGNSVGMTCEDTIIPSSENHGHWAAARLVPPSAPWTAEGVGFMMFGRGMGLTNCDSTPAHGVQLFLSDAAGAPDAEPTVAAELSIGSTEDEKADREIWLPLDSPLTVEADQVLYVAVDMPKGSCIRTCASDSTDGSHSWWSWATDAPYAWTSAGEPGMSTDVYDIRAFGS